MKTKALEKTILRGPSSFSRLLFSRDKNKIVTAGKGEIAIWSVATGDRLGSFPLGGESQITVRSTLLHARTASHTHSLALPGSHVLSMALSPDDAAVVVGCENGHVLHVDLQSGALRTLLTSQSAITWVALHGAHVFIRNDNALEMWTMDAQMVSAGST